MKDESGVDPKLIICLCKRGTDVFEFSSGSSRKKLKEPQRNRVVEEMVSFKNECQKPRL